MRGALHDLRSAVKQQDLVAATASLERIVKLDGPAGAALLAWAASDDHLALAAAALARGADPNGTSGLAPPIACVKSIAMARLLLDHGADIHRTWVPTRNEGRAAGALHYLAGTDENADLKRFLGDRLGLVDESALAHVEVFDLDAFWGIVEKARRAGKGDSTRQAREVVMMLRRRSVAELVAFQRRFAERKARLASPALWAFFHLVDGGCSDDTFLFEVPSRVISLGRTIYEAAVGDPDSLFLHVGKNQTRYVNYSSVRCDVLGEAAATAYRMLTGRDDFVRLVGPTEVGVRSLEWDPHDDDWLARSLPRTWAATRRRGALARSPTDAV